MKTGIEIDQDSFGTPFTRQFNTFGSGYPGAEDTLPSNRSNNINTQSDG